jgi:hypothetical protein
MEHQISLATEGAGIAIGGHRHRHKKMMDPSLATRSTKLATTITAASRATVPSDDSAAGSPHNALPQTPAHQQAVPIAAAAATTVASAVGGHRGGGSITMGSNSNGSGLSLIDSSSPRTDRSSVVSATSTTVTSGTIGNGSTSNIMANVTNTNNANNNNNNSNSNSGGGIGGTNIRSVTPPTILLHQSSRSPPLRMTLKSQAMRAMAAAERVTPAARAAAGGGLAAGPMTVEQHLAEQYYARTGHSLHARAQSQSSIASYTGPVKQLTINVLADTPEPLDQLYGMRPDAEDQLVSGHHSIIVDQTFIEHDNYSYNSSLNNTLSSYNSHDSISMTTSPYSNSPIMNGMNAIGHNGINNNNNVIKIGSSHRMATIRSAADDEAAAIAAMSVTSDDSRASRLASPGADSDEPTNRTLFTERTDRTDRTDRSDYEHHKSSASISIGPNGPLSTTLMTYVRSTPLIVEAAMVNNANAAAIIGHRSPSPPRVTSSSSTNSNTNNNNAQSNNTNNGVNSTKQPKWRRPHDPDDDVIDDDEYNDIPSPLTPALMSGVTSPQHHLLSSTSTTPTATTQVHGQQQSQQHQSDQQHQQGKASLHVLTYQSSSPERVTKPTTTSFALAAAAITAATAAAAAATAASTPTATTAISSTPPRKEHVPVPQTSPTHVTTTIAGVVRSLPHFGSSTLSSSIPYGSGIDWSSSSPVHTTVPSSTVTTPHFSNHIITITNPTNTSSNSTLSSNTSTIDTNSMITTSVGTSSSAHARRLSGRLVLQPLTIAAVSSTSMSSAMSPGSPSHHPVSPRRFSNVGQTLNNSNSNNIINGNNNGSNNVIGSNGIPTSMSFEDGASSMAPIRSLPLSFRSPPPIFA